MTTSTARPGTGGQRARFAATSKTLRTFTAIAAVALLASCGGGDEPALKQAPQDASIKRAQRVFRPRARSRPTPAPKACGRQWWTGR